MRLIDVLTMAVHNLRQRAFRTVLNLVGVVIGCIVLLMTSAGVTGVKEAFHVLFDSSEFARQIEVALSWESREEPPTGAIVVEGEMSDERRERIRERLVQQWKIENTERDQYTITKAMLDDWATWDHVIAVVPYVHIRCRVTVGNESGRSDSTDDPGSQISIDAAEAIASAAGPPSDSMSRSILAGTALQEHDHAGALIHEFLAYQLGYHDDAELQKLVGQEIQLEWKIEGKVSTLFRTFTGQYRKLTDGDLSAQLQFVQAFNQIIADLDRTSLTDAQKDMVRSLVAGQTEDARRDKDDIVIRRTFTVRGIYRPGANESFTTLFYQQLTGERHEIQLHRDVITKLQMLDPEQQDFYSAVVIIDSTANLREVTDRLEESDMRVFSAVSVIESIERQIETNGWVVYGIAGAILLTAMIGISNTLIISVMERTPEFGVMKAVGARDRDIVTLMMLEGALLGLLGAAAAIVLSWTLSFGIQAILERYIEYQISSDIGSTLFRFAVGPVLMTVGVSILVCVTASIVPAIRAARLDPVVAMRRT